MIDRLRRAWFGREQKMRCPSCYKRGFREWHEETDTFKRGGRWCPSCSYGVHPPAEAA